MRCCAQAWRCHSRGRYVPDTAAYRNSQFARAFTFEFPLLTFRIVVLHSTPGAPLPAAAVHHERPNGSRDPSSFSFISRGEYYARWRFRRGGGKECEGGNLDKWMENLQPNRGGGCGEEWSGGEKLRFDWIFFFFVFFVEYIYREREELGEVEVNVWMSFIILRQEGFFL